MIVYPDKEAVNLKIRTIKIEIMTGYESYLLTAVQFGFSIAMYRHTNTCSGGV